MTARSSLDREVQRARGVSAEVLSMGGARDVACGVVAAHLGEIMGLPGRVGPPVADVDFALVPSRGQLDAARLTRRLARKRPANRVRLGVTELDIFIPMFTHVYGEAEVGGGVAVVSTHRLGGHCTPPELRYQRLAKVACHEAGHALGLTHCRQPGCLMCFVGRLEALDQLTLGLCPGCRQALAVGRAMLRK